MLFADDLAAEQIDDAGQVEEAFVGGDIRDVGGPFLVRCVGGEVAVQSIRKHGMVMVGIGGGDAELALDEAGDAVLPHPFGDGVDAAVQALFQQILMDIGGSIAAVGFGVGLADGLHDNLASEG
jgi:hypothetical protein